MHIGVFIASFLLVYRDYLIPPSLRRSCLTSFFLCLPVSFVFGCIVPVWWRVLVMRTCGSCVMRSPSSYGVRSGLLSWRIRIDWIWRSEQDAATLQVPRMLSDVSLMVPKDLFGFDCTPECIMHDFPLYSTHHYDSIHIGMMVGSLKKPAFFPHPHSLLLLKTANGFSLCAMWRCQWHGVVTVLSSRWFSYSCVTPVEVLSFGGVCGWESSSDVSRAKHWMTFSVWWEWGPLPYWHYGCNYYPTFAVSQVTEQPHVDNSSVKYHTFAQNLHAYGRVVHTLLLSAHLPLHLI